MTDWVQKQLERIHGEQGQKGGPGSGHHGHAGRPGQVGGSAPGKGGDGTIHSGQPDYSGPVEFGRDTITRSHYGQTRGEQLKREIQVTRTVPEGYQAAVLVIRQMRKQDPFRIYGLSGNQVGNEHASLRSVKREATAIAAAIEWEDQLP